MKVNMREANDLLLDDLELLLREIDEFNTAISNNKSISIPQSLENYLQFVAKSGNTVFPWPHVRNLIRTKMVNAIQQFQEPTCPNESFVLERFDLFRLAAPFTVQRLTELILQPTRHYRKKEKFLRGLEKTVLVVSTVEPHSLTNNDEERNGNDTSSSSCEAETETVTFNRTITLDPQDILISSIRTASIDVLNPTTADTIALDPVRTTVVGNTVDVTNQNITVTSGSLISDSVTTSAVSSVEVITPDQPITASSEAVILENVTDPKPDGLESMESGEEDILPVQSSSIDVMDQSVVLDPVSSVVVGTAVDVITQSLTVTSDSVPSSAVSSVEVITPDQPITESSEAVILENVADTKPADLESMDSGEAQDILPVQSSSIDVMEQSIVLEPVSSVVGSAVDVVTQSTTVTSDSVTTSAASTVEVITPDQPITESSEAVILENVTDPKPAEESMESGEAQDTLPVQSSSIDVMDQSIVLDPVSSVVGSAVDVITQSITVTSDSVTSSAVSSIEVITPDPPIIVSSEAVILENVDDSKAADVDSMDSAEGNPL